MLVNYRPCVARRMARSRGQPPFNAHDGGAQCDGWFDRSPGRGTSRCCFDRPCLRSQGGLANRCEFMAISSGAINPGGHAHLNGFAGRHRSDGAWYKCEARCRSGQDCGDVIVLPEGNRPWRPASGRKSSTYDVPELGCGNLRRAINSRGFVSVALPACSRAMQCRPG